MYVRNQPENEEGLPEDDALSGYFLTIGLKLGFDLLALGRQGRMEWVVPPSLLAIS